MTTSLIVCSTFIHKVTAQTTTLDRVKNEPLEDNTGIKGENQSLVPVRLVSLIYFGLRQKQQDLKFSSICNWGSEDWTDVVSVLNV